MLLIIRAAVISVVLILPQALTLALSASAPAVDLRRDWDVRLQGADYADGMAAGDVNGDGARDVVVGSLDMRGEPAGGAYVVFGPFSQEDIDLNALDGRGFEIHAASDQHGVGRAIAIDDLNGDGRDDLVLGAPVAGNNDRWESGTTYVVFGKDTTTPVFLSFFDSGLQGSQGFRIDGPYAGTEVGRSVAALGDVNKDGWGDIALGSWFGSTYVVFGRSETSPLDLSTFHEGTQGDSGYYIKTPRARLNHYYSVGAAGDVNADGTPDIIVGVIKGLYDSGSAYVVFGHEEMEPIDLTNGLVGEGFRVRGNYGGAEFGYTVRGIGDVNRDGLGDVVVGAPGRNVSSHGAVYVVFGKKGSRLIKTFPTIGKNGYAIFGERYASIGDALDTSDDISGDGRGEALIGHLSGDYRRRDGAGKVFVVYGKQSSRKIELPRLGTRGYVIVGARTHDLVGHSVAGLGDVNGDGVPDVGLTMSPNERDITYISFGRLPPD